MEEGKTRGVKRPRDKEDDELNHTELISPKLVIESDDELVAEFKCGICIELPYPPVATTHCQHVFCAPCLERLFPPGQLFCKCPYRCGQLLRKGAWKPFGQVQRSAWNILCKIRVYCAHHAAGCAWIGTYGDLERHATKICPYRKMTCGQCGVIVRQREIAEHEEKKCPHRLTICQKCQEVLRVADMDKHDTRPEHPDSLCSSQRTCPNPGCLQIIRKGTLTDHRRTCAFQPVTCRICTETMIGHQAMEEHDTKAQERHLAQLRSLANQLEETEQMVRLLSPDWLIPISYWSRGSPPSQSSSSSSNSKPGEWKLVTEQVEIDLAWPISRILQTQSCQANLKTVRACLFPKGSGNKEDKNEEDKTGPELATDAWACVVYDGLVVRPDRIAAHLLIRDSDGQGYTQPLMVVWLPLRTSEAEETKDKPFEIVLHPSPRVQLTHFRVPITVSSTVLQLKQVIGAMRTQLSLREMKLEVAGTPLDDDNKTMEQLLILPDTIVRLTRTIL